MVCITIDIGFGGVSELFRRENTRINIHNSIGRTYTNNYYQEEGFVDFQHTYKYIERVSKSRDRIKQQVTEKTIERKQKVGVRQAIES